MKKYILYLLLILWTGFASAQQSEIVENTQRSKYEGKSYLVVGSLTLKPGFQFKASGTGTFYAKPLGGEEKTAPSEQENFIRKETIFKEYIRTDYTAIDLSAGDKSTSFSYMDGMGRTLMSVAVQSSPSKKDIVQPAYYDSKNQPSRNYLPYTASTTDGSYNGAAITAQQNYYAKPPSGVKGDSKPYSTVTFDDSPLERVLSSTKVGANYQSKSMSQVTKVNIANTVRSWTVYNGLPRSTAYYAAYTLTYSESKDEEGSITRTYVDFTGKEILTQVQKSTTEWLNTYYVYNDYGELLFVIPPEASSTYTPSKDFVNAYCFQYQYDDLGREIRSRTPGTEGWNTVIYDQWDRPVLTQDPLQAKKSPKEWSFAKYDIHNRIVVSGIITSTASEASLRASVGGASGRYEARNATAIGYTLNQTYPTTVSSSQVLAISYYDDYGFIKNAGWDPEGKSFAYSTPSGFTNTKTTGTVKGLETGSKSRTTAASTQWLHSVTYYDKYYRPVQTISGHIKKGTLRSTTEYNFAGEVLKTLSQYTGSGGTHIIQYRYTYDHAGRPLRVYHKLNSDAEVLLSEMVYNDLGQLTLTKHHSRNGGSTMLYETAMDYTIQGWMNNKTYRYPNGGKSLFSLQMGYENSLGTGIKTRYDGLPSAIRWKHADDVGDKAYNYTYDMAGRLTDALYKQKNTGTSTWLANNLYNEQGISYTANGNIKSLKRNRSNNGIAVTMDQLSYNYGISGNKLVSVTDNAPSSYKDGGFKDGNTGTDYTYNANGNLTKDANKGISTITYNRLDLPEKISFADGSTIQYVYDAGGGLLKETRQIAGESAKTIEYLGALQYENNVLTSIYHEAGKVDAATKMYQYYLTDQLGSTRVVLQEGRTRSRVGATFEPNNAQVEATQFMDYEEAVKIGEPLFDHTDTKGSGYAMRLSGGQGENVGIARSVSVLPGDTVRMRVYGKYLDLESKQLNPAVMALMGSVAGTAATVGVDGAAAAPGALGSQEAHPFAGMLGSKNSAGEAPPAYLNYLFFDKDRNYKHGGYVQMSEAAREDGTNVPHEELYQEVVAEEPGYYYIYLSNDSKRLSEAFFDDFEVEVAEGPIVQMTNYYPYGLIAQNWVREGEAFTKELFQSKTLDEKTGWYDFHARQYDASLGRWFAMDPQNQFASPYLAMGNKPVVMVDPDGEFVWVIPLAVGAVVNVASNWAHIKAAGSIWQGLGKAVGYAGVGALQGASSMVGGPAGLALGGAIGGLGNGLLQGMSGTQLLVNAGIGAVSGVAGGSASQYAGKLVGNITSPLLDGLVKGAAGGGAGGFVAGGIGSSLTGGNFMEGAVQGAWQGAAFGAGIGGAVNAYTAAKAGYNPLTGQRTKTWLANNPPRESVTLKVERPKLTEGTLEKRQIRGNIYDADFKQALNEWNNVRQQYGLKPITVGEAYGGDRFKPFILPDGSKVGGKFYYGGNTNPNGWNIKINMYAPSQQPKLPSIHLRYLNIPK